MENLLPLKTQKNPPLFDWEPNFGEVFYRYDGDNVIADYNSKVGKMDDISTLPIFFIKKTHYKTRMPTIVHHMNYFTRFYDLDRDTFFSMMAVKYYIDTHLNMDQHDFINMVMDRVVNKHFISKCKMMSCDLYTLDINSDSSGKFNSTPKITNAQAFQIVAISFGFKIITPLILHFANINKNFDPSVKTEYIKWFDKLFNRMIKLFEKDDVPFYSALCRFVVFRGEKLYRNNMTAFYQKKMLRGDTLELYNEQLIREVVCVKTLYKLDYRMSCVAFIDGVVHNFNTNYLKENFASKPYEIDSEDTSRDSDDSMSHAESMEQITYKRDESSAMIADINSNYIMNELRQCYKAFNISKEEFDFYYNHFYPNTISQYLFSNFYYSKFKDPYAVANINREDTVYLLICMKKILQGKKLYHLAHICTAKVKARYKENLIKNSQFIEKVTTSQVYKEAIAKKYHAIMELGMKENPLLKPLTTIINSAYELVDFDPEINGVTIEHIDQDAVADEYSLFLSII